jgi:hypothetical protein
VGDGVERLRIEFVPSVPAHERGVDKIRALKDLQVLGDGPDG